MQPIVPDVFVRPGPDGGFIVELNSDTLPKVLVNQSYYARGRQDRAKSDKDKTYLADCLQTATWLVRALDQRAKTILKVSTEIVRQQDAFFAHGVQHLRPLNLKTVADAIGMHESTVSRVTANKYMATNRGIFELKYFFTSAIAAADGGEAHSAEAVRHRIKQLIDAESARDVLSDDTIVEKLREAGVDIARRTVAKYREAMRIPSSVQRRREKQAALRRCLLTTVMVTPTRSVPGASAAAQSYPRSSAPVGSTNAYRRPIMPFRISGKNIDIGEALRARDQRRGSPRPRRKYFDGGYSGHVTIGKEGFGFRTECVIHLDSGITLRSRGDRRRCLCQRRSGGTAHREAAAPLQAPAQGSPGAPRRRPRADEPASTRRATSSPRPSTTSDEEIDRVQPGHHRRNDDDC